MEFYNKRRYNLSDDELILADIKAVLKQSGERTITKKYYDTAGKYGLTTIATRFGSWNNALSQAGLELNKTVTTKQELFYNLWAVWAVLGRQPVWRELHLPLSKYGIKPYLRVFGKWMTAINEFVAWSKEHKKMAGANGGYEGIKKLHMTSREVPLKLRHLVMRQDKYRCRLCGASPANGRTDALQIDHIKPWALGGETVIDNLQTLCEECNSGKGGLYLEEAA